MSKLQLNVQNNRLKKRKKSILYTHNCDVDFLSFSQNKTVFSLVLREPHLTRTSYKKYIMFFLPHFSSFLSLNTPERCPSIYSGFLCASWLDKTSFIHFLNYLSKQNHGGENLFKKLKDEGLTQRQNKMDRPNIPISRQQFSLLTQVFFILSVVT